MRLLHAAQHALGRLARGPAEATGSLADLPPAYRHDRKSVVLVSYHKAGSSIAQRILAELLGHGGLRTFALSDVGRRLGAHDFRFFAENQALLKRPGYFFGAMRMPYVAASALAPAKVVALIRDPRDCLVSLYFSHRFSHVAPEGQEHRVAFERSRLAVDGVDINDYCVSRARRYVRCLDFIGELADRHPDFLLVRYEDMVSDFDGWLRTVRAFADPQIPDSAIEGLKAQISFAVTREDPNAHMRQVTPGDHRRKLTAEAVVALTDRLAPQLRRFGYLDPTAASHPRSI